MDLESYTPFSSAYPLRRSRSVEIRGGKLLKSCDCIKRNGLQQDCRRTECIGRSCCSSGSTCCSPGSSALKMANCTMGMGARSGYQPSRSNYGSDFSQYGNIAAEYAAMGDVGGRGFMQSSAPDMGDYAASFDPPADASMQYMPSQQQVPAYGACMPTNEHASGSYPSYGPMNMDSGAGMGYGDYVQS